jgi:hypothetical protein
VGRNPVYRESKGPIVAVKNGIVQPDEIQDPKAGSLLDQLRAQPEETSFDDADPWIPAIAGEGLEGEVIKIDSFHDSNYGNDRILRTWIVKDDAGAVWSVIPFHRRLAKLMTMHRAEEGDRVAILYLGEKPSATDPESIYKDYRVARVAASRQRRMRAAGDAARIMTPDAFGTKLSDNGETSTK